MKKPKPIVTAQVCDICGEDWAKHPEDPTPLDCVEILKQRPKVIIPPYTINTTSAPTGYTMSSVGNVHPFRRPDDDDGLTGGRVPA